MSNQVRCTCSRCTIRGLMGPAIITTLGILFLLSELRGGDLSFSRTFPVLFIVIGGVLLGAAFASMDGHVDPQSLPPAPPAAPPAAPMPPAAPPNYGSPYPGQGQ
ncbi:MAG TPA: hypothetical protein VMT51_06110 [Dongiaceae bacterium]|nr:hypothetical protein [Dongiaceae bacterium]